MYVSYIQYFFVITKAQLKNLDFTPTINAIANLKTLSYLIQSRQGFYINQDLSENVGKK